MRCWAVDAGGSCTTAMAEGGHRWGVGSINPASVGAAAADAELSALFAVLADNLGPRPVFGWLATATVDADAPEPELARLTALATVAGLTGTLVISRDIVPLLAARPLCGRGVAVVCGTGSGFLAGDGSHPPVSVGGCEYLGSDEGSGFDIGLAGLRAAVRGSDGRGPRTLLAQELTANSAGAITDLARTLAARPFPKAAVAALAPAVCRCWLAGDAVAGAIVDRALDELVAGVRAARDRAGLGGGTWSAVLSGGVFRGCPEFAAALAGRLTDELGATPRPAVVDDPVAMVLAAATTHRDEFPNTLAGRWAWPRELGTAP
ncbi:BadF/BadG/BcrA/BcrD ATPase family protein [Actinophytocola oryzae]|uniref:N-acetylglucosamine kinase-like BadF-type ATPase n=1 Tax=Actinophytocola oryzae TaxID=502181 RepID=A0A4R7W1M6_9PSEU|nr:BadF/BadG/BcrA/BcrD ATPase family protein [Actinophytocola oryzae]TDV56312.1 N-acetylglucosamine kinase-like BadF-type ATPase [Actinophytocola oryzae]